MEILHRYKTDTQDKKAPLAKRSTAVDSRSIPYGSWVRIPHGVICPGVMTLK